MPKFTSFTDPATPTLRPLSWRDVDGGTPLREVLISYVGYSGSGWAASAALGGRSYQIRSGGLGGPRSRASKGEPGCYARDESGAVFEVLVPGTVPAPAPVDVEISLVPVAAFELGPLGVPAPNDLLNWGVDGAK